MSGEIIEVNTFDALPEWTIEDFTGGSKPHAWVLEHGDGDVYKTMRYRDMTAEVAKKLGIRNFVSQFNAYERSHRNDGVMTESNATDYEDQPLELMVGEYVCNDSSGVVGWNAYHERVQICSHPIMPTKRMINVDTGETQLEIAYRRGGRWRYQTVPRTMLATASQIVGLSAWGVGVDSENAKALVRYFTEVEGLNYGKLPEINSTGRLGWVGDDLFAPYVKDLQYDGDPSGAALFRGVAQAGSPAVWLDYFSKVRSRNVVTKIVLASSFASCMVKPCRTLPFIVHTWGGTEAGKSVALMAAISVWGVPTADGGLFHTFNTTDVGVEVLASVSNSIPVFIDELQIAKDRKSFDEFIYKFAEGVGRTRGAKAGGLQQMKRWANIAITTGEMPISTANSGGGAVNRVIEIDCKGQQLFENPREAVGIMSENYGHAGRYFVSLLQNNIELARDLQEDYLAQLRRTDVTDKQALSASLLLAADHLAAMWMFGDEDRLTVDEILPFLSTREQVDINARALDWLYGWVAENVNNFVGHGEYETGKVYGRLEEDKIMIIRKTFNEVMQDVGFNATAFLAWANSKGLVEPQGRHLDKMVRVRPGMNTRCVVLKAQQNSEELPEIDISDLPE